MKSGACGSSPYSHEVTDAVVLIPLDETFIRYTIAGRKELLFYVLLAKMDRLLVKELGNNGR